MKHSEDQQLFAFNRKRKLLQFFSLTDRNLSYEEESCPKSVSIYRHVSCSVEQLHCGYFGTRKRIEGLPSKSFIKIHPVTNTQLSAVVNNNLK